MIILNNHAHILSCKQSGHMPSVRVWDMEDPSHPQISEMAKGHKFGVSCVVCLHHSPF